MKHYSTTCQYYGGEARACGKPSQPGKSYCSDHVWVVYQKGTTNSKKRADAAFEKVLQRIEAHEDINLMD